MSTEWLRWGAPVATARTGIVLMVLAVGGTGIPLNAYAGTISARDNCGGRILSMGRAIIAQQRPLIAELKRTGDCSIVPRLVALEIRFMALCRQRAAQYGYCGATCNAYKSIAQYERDFHRFCKSKPNAVVAAPTPPIQPKAPSAASSLPNQQSADCSDITGTDSNVPAATDCKDAVADRDVARVNRKKNPELSKYSYKKAAEAAHRAGDTNLELSILREATELPPVEQSAEQPCATSTREAASYILGAETIEKKDPSCAGLRQAAENYLTAGKIFFRDVKIGQRREDVESSCAIKLTDTMLQRGNALNDRVDRMKQEGKCEQGLRIPPPTPDETPKIADGNDEQRKKECAEMVSKLAAHAPDRKWLEQELARSHCKPDGTPMSLREALDYEMRKQGDQ